METRQRLGGDLGLIMHSQGEEEDGSARSSNSMVTAFDETSEAMTLARDLCVRIHEAGDVPNAKIMEDLRKDLDKLHTLVQTEARQTELERARCLLEKDAMRAEIHAEQVDREANAARVSERQRFLFERQEAQQGQSSAAERAVASASYVEAALTSLCPHANQLSPGTVQLAQL